jgi:aminopeptidase N
MGKKVARLYEQFQPERYGLSLNIQPDQMYFNGTVTIEGKKVGRPSERITLHQKDLEIVHATIQKSDKKTGDYTEVPITRINKQNSLNEVRLHTEEKLFPGEYRVSVDFTGKITRPMNGIYPCFFKHDGKDKMLIATQFESHHAREAFPCIDEPEAKTTFDLQLITPKDGTVLANTPVIKQEQLGDGRLNTSFETTPKMSTYLLAFAYGELGYKESRTKDGVVIRAYATPDNVALTDHGVDVAVNCLEFFSEYFDMPYPMPKLDMVALPDFSSGAMENWGLVTYRETAMLADPQTSSIETKQMVALVICHELSHQWFGNLVTMKWWDDLWLNESFANMMEYRAVDALYPEWNIWEQFISHEGVSAKRRDSLADVQPVHTGVNHPDEISTLFDPSIVYAKGGTILYMLMNYIGEDDFRTGLKAYFEKHAYGNTVADDLWEALSTSSGKDIGGFMDKWLHASGYPLVETNYDSATGALELSQRRFLSDPDATPSDTMPWQVPLAPSVEITDKPLLGKQSQTLSLKPDSINDLLLNHNGTSYFLPYYTNDEHRKAIIQALRNGDVSDIDRFLLLDNSILLQRSISPLTDLLDMLEAYEGERSETVWGAIAMSVGEVRKLIEGDEPREANLNAIIAQLVAPLVKELGWDDKAGDTAQVLRLRGLVVSIAAGAKVQSVIDEGLKRFQAFTKPSDLSPSTRSVVYFCGVRHGDNADFEKLLTLYKTIQNADEKDEIASGLTSAKDEGQYATLLDTLKTDTVRRQDLMHWYAWLLRNRYSRKAAWRWLKDNWEWIEQEFSSDKSYGYFPRFCGGVFSHKSELDDYNKFFEPKKSIVALARDITLAGQEIQSRVTWRERNEEPVQAWLDNHKA